MNRRVVKGDFDGDGMTDLIFVGAADYISASGRFLSTTGTLRGNSTNVPVTSNWRDDTTLIIGDYNGDRNADVLQLTASGLSYCPGPGIMASNNCTAVANTSGDWNSTYQAVRGDFNADGYEDLFLASAAGTFLCAAPAITATNNCVAVNNANWRNAKVVAADFSGAGGADVFAAETGAMKLARGASSAPDLMLQATNTTFGTATSFTYKTLTDTTVYTKGTGAVYPLQDTGSPLYVVSRISYPNGIGGTNDKNYTYEKARFSLDGRGSLGFEVVRERDAARSLLTISTQSQAFPHFGRVLDVDIRLEPSMSPLSKTTRTLGTVNSFEGRPSSRVIAETLSTKGLDGVWASEYVGYIYDAYGNLRITNWCRDEFSCPTYKRTLNYTFQNDPTQWLFGQKTREQRQFFDALGNSIAWRTDFTLVPGTMLIQQQIRDPSDAPLKLTTTYARDAFGNITSTSVSGVDIDTRTTLTEYDSEGRFVTSTTNPLGHVSTSAFDPRFGALTSSTDPNNLTTTRQLDNFGRTTSETRPDGTQTTWNYDICCPEYAMNGNLAYRITSTNTGSSQPEYTYFDILDREVLTVRRNFADTDWIDTKNIWYDAAGKAVRSYLPYERLAANKPYVASTYDTRGRLSTQTAPDGGVTTHTYSNPAAGSPVTITVKNARNFETKYVRSVRDELLQVIDANLKTTSYEYTGLGKVSKITDSKGNQTTMSYNKHGLVTSNGDPDLGTWTYVYDRLLQLSSQIDAKSQVTNFFYDKLGRKIQRSEPSMTATWTWDTATKGVGKLASTSTNGAVTRTFLYDVFGRPMTQTLTVDGIGYPMTNAYDAAGRPETLTYPTGFSVKNVYNGVGQLAEVRNAANNALFWRAVGVSPAGVTDEDYGNGTGVVRVFDSNTQRINQIGTVRDSDGSTIQNYTYTYDLAGNMASRSETTQSVSETYTYDSLDRLATVVRGANTKFYNYDDIGNTIWRPDVGIYTYPATGKVHAVSSIGSIGYTYDQNGNLLYLSDGSRSFTWKSFNKPATAQAGASVHTWVYDADQSRVKDTSSADTTIFVGSGSQLFLEKVVKPGLTEQRHHIYANGRSIAQYTQRSTGGDETSYYYRDHLGSTTLILNEADLMAERLSYDSQGKRRFPNGSDDPSNTLTGLASDRGFTGHEHLDELTLIHMNGRLYDPKIGRFVSADPVSPELLNPQNLNRYSYVLNNPLLYVDPTGFTQSCTQPGPGCVHVDGTRLPDGRLGPGMLINGPNPGPGPRDPGGGNPAPTPTPPSPNSPEDPPTDEAFCEWLKNQTGGNPSQSAMQDTLQNYMNVMDMVDPVTALVSLAGGGWLARQYGGMTLGQYVLGERRWLAQNNHIDRFRYQTNFGAGRAGTFPDNLRTYGATRVINYGAIGAVAGVGSSAILLGSAIRTVANRIAASCAAK